MTAPPPAAPLPVDPSPGVAVLLLVRHAATANNLRRPYVLQGRRLDDDLAELGVRQAEATTAALRETPLTAVVASPLKRARRTAEIIAAPHGLAVEIDDDLAEAEIGLWEGKGWAEIEREWPDEYRRFRADEATVGYMGGENFFAVADRAAPVLERFALRHAGRTTLAVCHNVVNRVVLARWMGLPLEWARRLPQYNGGVNVVEVETGPAGPRVKVRTVNAADHVARLQPPAG
ncbi:MAG: histidine phosphatase family protein [Planctomycetia bacterium]